MRYGDLVRDAFRISWRNKFLWFFGIFAAGSSFSGGGGGGGNSSGGDQDLDQFNDLTGSVTDALSPQAVASGQMPTMPGNIPGILAFQSGQAVGLIIGLIVLAVVVAVLFIALNLISQGALAESVAAIKRGETRRFGGSFRVGLSNLPGLFFQAILIFLIALGLLLAIGLVAGGPILLTFLLSQSVGLRIAMTVVFVLVGILLLVVLFIPFVIIAQLAVRERVVGESGVVSSVGAAYRLFRANIGSSLLVWLLNIGLKIGIGIVFVIAILISGAILLGPGIALYFAVTEVAGIVVGIIGGLLFLVLLLLATGAVGTFIHSYWTLAYLQLTGRDVPPETRGEAVPLQ